MSNPFENFNQQMKDKYFSQYYFILSRQHFNIQVHHLLLVHVHGTKKFCLRITTEGDGLINETLS